MTTLPPPLPPRPDATLPPPPPPPVAASAPPSSASSLVAATTILLAVGALSQAWYAVAIAVRRHAALQFIEQRGGIGAVETGDHLVQSAVVARYALLLATTILLAMWLTRVVRMNAWLGRRDTAISPGLAAGSWFIPLANLILPAIVVMNAWKASDPALPLNATAADASERSSTPIIGAWWACWLGAFLTQVLVGATATIKSGDSERVRRDLLDRQLYLSCLGVALTIAAAVLGALVVSRLAGRQRDAIERRLRGV